ncbi:hypothetical protein IAU60_004531 [Kwoniella sp. DSM 27419]
MTAPIPISSSPTHSSYSHANNPILSPPQPSHTPGSSVSISPQTPFFPPPGLATSSTPTQSSGLIKWASSFGKSPSNTISNMSPNKQSGFDVPPTIHDEEDHEHEHDSFEFGDYGDLKSRSWAGTSVGSRRCMSMSYAPGAQSGIAAMLKGGFGDAPAGGGTNTGQPVGGNSMPAGSVLADKAAKGQGVLRRLSMSGGSYRASFLSPPMQSTPLPPSPPTVTIPAVGAAPAPPQAEPQLNRAATVTGVATSGRGRRYSEGQGQRKRGVSPMGERILRDHGGF